MMSNSHSFRPIESLFMINPGDVNNNNNNNNNYQYNGGDDRKEWSFDPASGYSPQNDRYKFENRVTPNMQNDVNDPSAALVFNNRQGGDVEPEFFHRRHLFKLQQKNEKRIIGKDIKIEQTNVKINVNDNNNIKNNNNDNDDYKQSPPPQQPQPQPQPQPNTKYIIHHNNNINYHIHNINNNIHINVPVHYHHENLLRAKRAEINRLTQNIHKNQRKLSNLGYRLKNLDRKYIKCKQKERILRETMLKEKENIVKKTKENGFLFRLKKDNKDLQEIIKILKLQLNLNICKYAQQTFLIQNKEKNNHHNNNVNDNDIKIAIKQEFQKLM